MVFNPTLTAYEPSKSIEDTLQTQTKVPSIGNNWKPKPNGNNVSNNNIYYEPTTTTSTTTSTTMPYSTTTTYGQGRNQFVYAANQFSGLKNIKNECQADTTT